VKISLKNNRHIPLIKRQGFAKINPPWGNLSPGLVASVNDIK